MVSIDRCTFLFSKFWNVLRQFSCVALSHEMKCVTNWTEIHAKMWLRCSNSNSGTNNDDDKRQNDSTVEKKKDVVAKCNLYIFVEKNLSANVHLVGMLRAVWWRWSVMDGILSLIFFFFLLSFWLCFCIVWLKLWMHQKLLERGYELSSYLVGLHLTECI